MFFFLEHAGELRIIVLIEEKRVIHRPEPHTPTHHYIDTGSPVKKDKKTTLQQSIRLILQQRAGKFPSLLLGSTNEPLP